MEVAARAESEAGSPKGAFGAKRCGPLERLLGGREHGHWTLDAGRWTGDARSNRRAGGFRRSSSEAASFRHTGACGCVRAEGPSDRASVIFRKNPLLVRVGPEKWREGAGCGSGSAPALWLQGARTGCSSGRRGCRRRERRCGAGRRGTPTFSGRAPSRAIREGVCLGERPPVTLL